MQMLVKLEYGSSGLEVNFPSECTTVIEPLYVPSARDTGEVLLQALRSPIGTQPLRDLIRGGQSVGISVCDITRAQPRQIMLEALLSEMPRVRMEDVTIFIATGTHRQNTNLEIEKMLGREIATHCRIICHNAR